MNNDIEADYLVDKLAGRLETVCLKVSDEGQTITRDGDMLDGYHDCHEETLAEYSQRKEQTE